MQSCIEVGPCSFGTSCGPGNSGKHQACVGKNRTGEDGGLVISTLRDLAMCMAVPCGVLANTE